jgi:hypothetical protein
MRLQLLADDAYGHREQMPSYFQQDEIPDATPAE